MVEAWFSPEAAYGFSGLAVLGLTALFAPAIAKGRHRTAIVSLWGAVIVLGAGLLVAGLVAWAGHQPGHVTLPLIVCGLTIVLAYAGSLVFVLKVYRVAELRKVAAREL